MIAQKLAELAIKAQEDQQRARKRSDKARVAEEFGDEALKLFEAPDDTTDAEKIKAFDKLREMLVDNLDSATRSGIRGNGFRQEKDHEHFIYETAMQICLGADIFTGYNALSRMLGRSEND